jgi:hypothetical protein
MSAQRASPSTSSSKKLNPRENSTDKGVDEDKDRDKSFIAVRWPSTLRKPLKVAAAGSDPPLTMTEYLTNCFNAIEDEGGLSKRKKSSGTEAASIRRSDKEQRKRYQEASEKLFRTNDRRLIDLMISLLGYATR